MAKVQLPRRVQSPDRMLNEVQDAIAAPLREIVAFEELLGSTVRGVALTTVPQTVAHNLGRRPIGWRIVDKTTSGDAYRTAWDDRTITLRTASGSLSCDIYIW